jgi:stalled ribosome alternative rescue factor ArfA
VKKKDETKEFRGSLVLFRDGMEESKKNKGMYCKVNKRLSKKNRL